MKKKKKKTRKFQVESISTFDVTQQRVSSMKLAYPVVSLPPVGLNCIKPYFRSKVLTIWLSWFILFFCVSAAFNSVYTHIIRTHKILI